MSKDQAPVKPGEALGEKNKKAHDATYAADGSLRIKREKPIAKVTGGEKGTADTTQNTNEDAPAKAKRSSGSTKAESKPKTAPKASEEAKGEESAEGSDATKTEAKDKSEAK